MLNYQRVSHAKSILGTLDSSSRSSRKSMENNGDGFRKTPVMAKNRCCAKNKCCSTLVMACYGKHLVINSAKKKLNNTKQGLNQMYYSPNIKRFLYGFDTKSQNILKT